MFSMQVNGTQIKDIELVVFDKDGTLIDLYRYWSYMLRLRAEEICDALAIDKNEHKEGLMSAMGLDLENKRIKPDGPVGLHPRTVVQQAAENYLKENNMQAPDGICYTCFDSADDKSLAQLERNIRLLNGAMDILKAIRKKEGKIAIATSDKTKRAELTTQILGIDHFIDLVVGFDLVPNPKPEPDSLELILKNLNLNPEHAVMIGDASSDIQMGQSAHFCASIGVSSGLTSRVELGKKTTYVVDSLEDITIM